MDGQYVRLYYLHLVTGHIRGDLAGPQSEAICIDGVHLIADRGNVENQAEIFQREILGCGRRIDSETRKWEDAASLPLLNGCLDLGSPHEVGLIGSGRPLVRNGNIIVRASHFVLGAVTATEYFS